MTSSRYFLIQSFQEVGFTDDEIASFLSGPPFQAWNRFGEYHTSSVAQDSSTNITKVISLDHGPVNYRSVG